MRRISLLLFLATLLVWAPAAHSQAPPIAPPAAPPVTVADANISPDKPRTYDFAGESIDDVLRKLARAAKMNIVVADGLEGTVNMRIEDMTPYNAMTIIIESQNLFCKQGKGGVYYIRSKNPAIRVTEADKAAAGIASATSREPTKEEMNWFLMPALTGFFDAVLDYQARPEFARKRARAKKALYEAFIAEGFTKEEALRLILAAQEPSVFDNKE